MKKIKRICGLLLTCKLGFFVLGWGNVMKEILGKWVREDRPDKRSYVEFFSDNTFVSNESSAGASKGTYNHRRGLFLFDY